MAASSRSKPAGVTARPTACCGSDDNLPMIRALSGRPPWVGKWHPVVCAEAPGKNRPIYPYVLPGRPLRANFSLWRGSAGNELAEGTIRQAPRWSRCWIAMPCRPNRRR